MHLNEFNESLLLPRLGCALWSWKLCGSCQASSPCADETCPAYNSGRLRRFYQFYKAVVSGYADDASSHAYDAASCDNLVFRTHGDLFQAILLLRQNLGSTRQEFADLLLKTNSRNTRDVFRATDLAVKVLTMIDCSASYLSTDRLENGNSRICWGDDATFRKYLQDLFPTENHPVFSYPDSEAFADVKGELLGRKLKKHLDLKFRPTHDIRNHLRLNRRSNVLEIYHYTSFVKEQLRLTDPKSTMNILPRQLLLEVLDSLQGILFPLWDPKSRKFLESLVRSCSLDPDILRFEFSSIRNQGEESIRYIYLADRLSELYNELQNPRPRGGMWRWLERKSAGRHMIMATLVGVVIAVLLGILSLAISACQTWIAYQAWQHPVTPPSSEGIGVGREDVARRVL